MDERIREEIGMEIKSYKMLGTILLLLGFIALFFPVLMTGIVVFLIAFILILMGGLYLSLAIYGESAERNWHTWGKAFIMLAIGVLMLTNAQASAAVLTLLLGIFFVVMGAISILVGFTLKESGDVWYIFLVDGLVALFIGLILFMVIPEHSNTALGILLGIGLLIDGLSIMLIAGSYEKTLEEIQ